MSDEVRSVNGPHLRPGRPRRGGRVQAPAGARRGDRHARLRAVASRDARGRRPPSRGGALDGLCDVRVARRVVRCRGPPVAGAHRLRPPRRRGGSTGSPRRVATGDARVRASLRRAARRRPRPVVMGGSRHGRGRRLRRARRRPRLGHRPPHRAPRRGRKATLRASVPTRPPTCSTCSRRSTPSTSCSPSAS